MKKVALLLPRFVVTSDLSDAMGELETDQDEEV